MSVNSTRNRSVTIHPDHLLIDGQPTFFYGGDFNYSRTPRHWWRDRLLKMKAMGMNTVTFYITWAFHEPIKGKWEFDGQKDVGAFIDLIHEMGMFVIARLGPFVHGEWINGGLPQWLVDELGVRRCRSNDTEYLRYTRLWYEKELAIVMPRLATRGGPIVMLQLENELGSAGSKGDDIPRGSTDAEENRKHVLYYYKLVKEAGADVPIIDISHWPGRETAIPELVDTGGGYPTNYFGSEGEIWSVNRERWPKHVRPYITIETAGGMSQRLFDTPPYKNCWLYQGPIYHPSYIEALTLGSIAEGASGINFYVTTDGQHPDGPDGTTLGERMLPARDYNYQAAITVSGAMRESYAMFKRLGWMLRAFGTQMLDAKPHDTWATAVAYGRAHPGTELSGDLFEGYHADAGKSDALGLVRHVQKVDASARCTRGLNLSETNFLFLRNTKIHGSHWQRDIRILSNPRGIPCETSREYPRHVQLSLPPQRNKILPFYLKIADGVYLEYSTAEPLDQRSFGGSKVPQLILFADADEVVETSIVVAEPGSVETTSGVLPLWDAPHNCVLVGRPGPALQVTRFGGRKPVRVVHVNRELAGMAWDVASPQGPVVAFSTMPLLESCSEGNRTSVTAEVRDERFQLWMLSERQPKVEGVGFTIEQMYDSQTGLYHATGVAPLPKRDLAWQVSRQSESWVWQAAVSPEILSGLADLIIEARYRGAHARAFLDNHLISDHYFGEHLVWEVALRDWLNRPGTLRLEFAGGTDAHVRLRPVLQTTLDIHWG